MRILKNRYLPAIAVAFLSLSAMGAPAPQQGGAGLGDRFYEKVADQCRKGTLDLPQFLSSLKNRPEALRLFDQTSASSLELYLGCQAGIPDQQKSCDLFQGMGSLFRRSNSNCLWWESYAATVWSMFRQGDAAAECQQLMARTPLKIGNVPRACGIFMEAVKGGQSQDFCGKLRDAGSIAPSDYAMCHQNTIFLQGKPDLCASVPGLHPVEQASCRERAVFLAAMRSSDPKSCSEVPLCQALTTHQPQSCRPYLLPAQKAVCAAIFDTVQKNADFARARFNQEAKARAENEAVEQKRKLLETERQKKAQAAQGKARFKKRQRMHTVDPEVEKRLREIEGPQSRPTAPVPNSQQ